MNGENEWKETETRKLRVFGMRCQRTLVGRSCWNIIRNEERRRKVGCEEAPVHQVD